jgi:hypothetical protein
MEWSWQPETPLEFILFFAACWVTVSYLLSAIGGWLLLASRYRASEPFGGRRWYFCSATFRRFTNYGGVLTIGANSQGLYLAVLPPFRLWHPPLFIPLGHIRKAPRKAYHLFSTPLELGSESPVRVTLSRWLVNQIEREFRNEIRAAA